MRYPYHKQQNDYYCGPTTVQMILGAHGIKQSQQALAKTMGTEPYSGTGRRALAKPLRGNGFRVRMKIHASTEEIRRLIREGWSVIVNYIEPEENIGHYALVTDVTPTHVVMHDPTHGPNFRIPRHSFLRRWRGRHLRAYTRWYLAAKE
jgi:predicted double-glycine peptidase